MKGVPGWLSCCKTTIRDHCSGRPLMHNSVNGHVSPGTRNSCTAALTAGTAAQEQKEQPGPGHELQDCLSTCPLRLGFDRGLQLAQARPRERGRSECPSSLWTPRAMPRALRSLYFVLRTYKVSGTDEHQPAGSRVPSNVLPGGWDSGRLARAPKQKKSISGICERWRQARRATSASEIVPG